MSGLRLPRKQMSFTVLEVTKMSKITVKVTPPFIWNRVFKDWDDFVEQTAEFIKQHSYEECFHWRVEVENKVIWYMDLPEVLYKAVEKRFWEELFKEARQR